ncbi:uncharacterized protein LOC117169231 isoform X2 [Belonocnema kinseyi]|uniref:uncharacterized protein LOC117169231 isoform X2 n=1 Tax=Belonocnema kinseyi TaxID=2817044 RepID=UPI00143CC301|nr:uncharacterized protein LOC117169231 isoform X2 [Belonocnema kinseyi]
MEENESLKKMWEEALSMRLNDVNAICELHFRHEDIELNYVTKMPDGSIHIIPRLKAKLKQNAIPSKNILSNTERLSSLMDVENLDFENRTQFIVLKENKTAENSAPLENPVSVRESSVKPEYLSPQRIQTTNTLVKKKDIDLLSNTERISNAEEKNTSDLENSFESIDIEEDKSEDYLITLENPESNTEIMSKQIDVNSLDFENRVELVCIGENNEAENSIPLENSLCITDNTVQLKSSSIKRILKKYSSVRKKNIVHQKEEKPDIYTFENLQKDMLKKLPNNWSSLNYNRCRVLLGQWNELGLSSKKLAIDKDMSSKVYINDVERELPGIKKVQSLQDVVHNLVQLDSIKPCLGLNENTRHEKCPGYVELCSRSVRCIPCRWERRKIIDRETTRIKRGWLKRRENKIEKTRPLKNRKLNK